MSTAIFCVILLLVPVAAWTPVQAEEHIPSKPEAAFTIDSSSADPLKRFEAFDAVTMAVFDLDGDGVMEIVAHNDNNNLYVFDGASGHLVWEFVTEHPFEWEARELAGPSIGDVNGNGLADIVATNSAGWVSAFEVRHPREPGGGLSFETLWESLMDPRDQDPDYLRNHPWVEFEGHPGLDGSAYLADATGDGRDEVFLQLDNMPGMFGLDGDGEVVWWNNWTEGNSNPVATDFTGDGRIEMMYPSDGGVIVLFDARDRYPLCSIDMKEEGPRPASISVAPTVVDLTGDGKKEMVFGVRNAVEDEDDPEWYLKQNAHFFAVTAECEVLWHQTWDWANPHVHMHPVPVDVDGDGDLEVLFQDWNTVGHSPGNWESTGNSTLFAVDGQTGDLIWQRDTRSRWSNKNVAVADVTGDGKQEILVVEPRGGQDGVMLYDLEGNRLRFVAAPEGWDVSRGPAVADLDGDGHVEMVLPVHRDASGCRRTLDVGCREGALQVFRTPGTGAPVWPNAKTYNHRYDDEGGALRAAGPEVALTQVDSQQGFALEIGTDSDVEAVHVRVPGSSSWQRLDHASGDRFEADLSFMPAMGDEVRVRVYWADERAGYYDLTAQGAEAMLRVSVTDRSGAQLGGAQVEVTSSSGTVWQGETASDGRVQIPVERGRYEVKASASGFRSGSADVDVDGEGVTGTTIRLASLWTFVLGVGGIVVAAAGLVVGGVVVKRRRRNGKRA